MSEEQQDRRGEVRIGSVNLINYSAIRTPDAPSEQEMYELLGTAQTLDISAGGCRVRTPKPLVVGTELSFDLQLADHIVSCKGRVMRLFASMGSAQNFEAGIQFLDLSEMAKDGIRLYLSFKPGNEE